MSDSTDQATKPAEPQKRHTFATERQARIIRFSADGSVLYGACYDGKIRRWTTTPEVADEADPKKRKPDDEIPATELPALEGHHGWVENLTFAPTHKLLLSTDSWGQLCAWNEGNDSVDIRWKHEHAHDGWLRALALSQDESLIATAGRDKVVRVWQTSDGKLLHELKGHEDEVFAVAIHPDNKSVISGDLFSRLKHWNLETGECQRETQLEKMNYYERDQDVAGLYSLRFDADGKTLLAAGSEPSNTGNVAGTPTIYWLNWETLAITKTMQFGDTKQGYVYDYLFHPDGYVMLVTSGAPGAGQFICQRLDEEEPFFRDTKMTNCHSLAFDAATSRCVVASTNRRSQGNGAVRDKDGNYVANYSPLAVFELS